MQRAADFLLWIQDADATTQRAANNLERKQEVRVIGDYDPPGAQ
jgi:hypothetical protein